MGKIFYFLIVCMFLSCCGQKGVTKGTDVTTNTVGTQSAGASKTPVFNADSAYAYIEKQVTFGPRVPNTEAHKACADYLATELERHGAEIYVQEAVLTAYNGDKLNARNIIGAFNPAKTRRILLFAHWDTRPYADHDPDSANHTKPFDGADDGGSGVGVLLEIARQIGANTPEVGIDIIFFDAEDYGVPSFAEDYYHLNDTWCLGSQFWAKNPHVRNYKAEFGILLDMVGSKGATFYKENTSVRYAGRYVEKVWATARELGYGKYFIQASGGGITDDHLYVNEIRRIPSIDIINYNPDSNTGFGAYWHTLNDNMRIIDKETLKAVGQTILKVIFD